MYHHVPSMNTIDICLLIFVLCICIDFLYVYFLCISLDPSVYLSVCLCVSVCV